MRSSRGRDAAVPVAVDVRGPAASRVVRVVEGVLGWSVVDADDVVLPPRLVLVDPRGAAAHAHRSTPLVLVVAPDDPAAAAARAGRHAAAVLDGVPDAASLRRVLEDVGAETPAGRAAWCTVTAAAGGVGATTVAAAVAGLRAWRHGPTLLVASGPAHQEDVPLLAGRDLGGPAAWAAASPAVGLADLRVVRLHPGPLPHDVGATAVVLDLGPREVAADVLVARPDRVGLEAVERGGHGAVVVVGRGAIEIAALRAAAGDRVVVAVPWSARVAAAAAAGRLPTDLPGSWLRLLEPLLATLPLTGGRP